MGPHEPDWTTIWIEQGESSSIGRVNIRRDDWPAPAAAPRSYHVPIDRLAELQKRFSDVSGDEGETWLAEAALELTETLKCKAHGLLNGLGEYVRVVTNLPYLPWELLCADPNSPLESTIAASRPVGRVLSGTLLPVRVRAPELTDARVLFVVDPRVPDEYGLLPAVHETHEQAIRILQKLKKCKLIDAAFTPPILAGVDATGKRVAEVLRNTADRSVDVLHICCHVERDGGLILADGAWSPKRIENEWAVPVGRFPQTVFINGCGSFASINSNSASSSIGMPSSLVHAFIKSGAASLIGTSWPVREDASTELATEFYKALIWGQPVGQALRRARQRTLHLASQEITTVRDISWAAYTMYGGPEIRLFAASQERERYLARQYLNGRPATVLMTRPIGIPSDTASADESLSVVLGTDHCPIRGDADHIAVLFKEPKAALHAALQITTRLPKDSKHGFALHYGNLWDDGQFVHSAYDELMGQAEGLWQHSAPDKLWVSAQMYDALRPGDPHGIEHGHWMQKEPVRLEGLRRIQPYEWFEGDGQETRLAEETLSARVSGKRIEGPAAFLSVGPWDIDVAGEWWFHLYKCELSIGWRWDNDVILRDPEGWPSDDGTRKPRVGRKHARLLRCKDGWYVEDGFHENNEHRGSGWGTWIAGQLVGDRDNPGGPRRVASGQRAHIGPTDIGPSYRLEVVQPSDANLTHQADTQVLPASLSMMFEASRGITAQRENHEEESIVPPCTSTSVAEALQGPVSPLGLLGYALGNILKWTNSQSGAIVGRVGDLERPCPLVLASPSRKQMRVNLLTAELLIDLLLRCHQKGKSWEVIDAPVDLQGQVADAYAVYAITRRDQWLGAIVLSLPRHQIDSRVRECMSLVATELASRPIWPRLDA